VAGGRADLARAGCTGRRAVDSLDGGGGWAGLALTDFGESETANLASASVMADQRSRFLKTRQSYFGYMLARLGLESYNRAVRLGRVRGKLADLSDVRIGFSDVSTADNGIQATSAAGVANALNTLYAMGVNGNAFKRLALRLVLRFAGEQVGESDLDSLLTDVVEVVAEPAADKKEQSDG
jgi:hypothetical protein